MAGTPAAIVDACHWSSAGCLQCLGKFGNLKSHPLASASFSHQSLSIWNLFEAYASFWLDDVRRIEDIWSQKTRLHWHHWLPMIADGADGSDGSFFSHVFSQVTAQPSAVATGAAPWPCWRTCNPQRCWDVFALNEANSDEDEQTKEKEMHPKDTENIRNHMKPHETNILFDTCGMLRIVRSRFLRMSPATVALLTLRWQPSSSTLLHLCLPMLLRWRSADVFSFFTAWRMSFPNWNIGPAGRTRSAAKKKQSTLNCAGCRDVSVNVDNVGGEGSGSRN